jgi:hypothetical protein
MEWFDEKKPEVENLMTGSLLNCTCQMLDSSYLAYRNQPEEVSQKSLTVIPSKTFVFCYKLTKIFQAQMFEERIGTPTKILVLGKHHVFLFRGVLADRVSK